MYGTHGPFGVWHFIGGGGVGSSPRLSVFVWCLFWGHGLDASVFRAWFFVKKSPSFLPALMLRANSLAEAGGRVSAASTNPLFVRRRLDGVKLQRQHYQQIYYQV